MDTSSSKTISFEFNHCLTKLTLEIDTSQMPGVYMIKNNALTYGVTSVKIPLTPGREYDYSAMDEKIVDLSYENVSNNVSVVNRTEIFLAYPNELVAFINMRELYLTDDPAANALKETYMLKFNKVLETGKNYRAKVSVKKSAGPVLNNVQWAPGILYMIPRNTYEGNYYGFREGQEIFNYGANYAAEEYFGWNTLEPNSFGRPPLGSITAWEQGQDPCLKAPGRWESPTRAQFDELIATGQRDGKLNGVNGTWFGPSENPTVFFPFIGKRNMWGLAHTSDFWYQLKGNMGAESGSAPKPIKSDMTFFTYEGDRWITLTKYPLLHQAPGGDDTWSNRATLVPVRCCRPVR